MDLSSKYEIRQQIGKGSFGSAFLVTNKQEKKDYVLKRVRLAKQTKWQRSSTLQERDLVTTLQHPFIVPCIEAWTVQGHTVNMIYGYCEKGDLASYLQRVQKAATQVDEGQMVKWLCQLLLALDYLQANKVLHRDIKTSNLMLTSDIDVQIGDFGLATRMQGADEGSKPQDTNLVGTPHYMSPELLSCKDYGFKTDVWSLGCVFYELTAQRPTFNAFNIHGLVSKIKKNKLAPLPESYSSEWRGVVGMMLVKDPDKRPSVQELMALPCLRPGMLQARKRAQQLMPDVQLPPLLHPTPFVVRRSISISSGQDGDSDAEAGPADALTAVPAGRVHELGDSSNSSSTWAASALATHALGESELSEVWRVNSLQRDGSLAKFQLQQHSEQAPPQQLDGETDGTSRVQQQFLEPYSDLQCADTFSSRCSDSSRASSCSPASRQKLSTTGGIDSAGRRSVYQPGIRATQSERVAAAIAAARSKAAAEADDQAPLGPAAAPLGPAMADSCVTQDSSSKGGSTKSSSKGGGSSTSASAANPKAAQQEAAAAFSARLALYKEAKATAAGGQTSGSTPAYARGIVQSSPRPAWNAGAAHHSSSPAVAGRQRSSTGRAAGPASTLKAAAAVASSTKVRDTAHSTRPGLPKPQSGGAQKTAGDYLQSLEDKKQKQQEQQQCLQSSDSGVQQLLSDSQQLSHRVVELQQGVQADGIAHSAQQEQPPLAGTSSRERQQQECTTKPGGDCDSDSEDCEFAVKQLRFDSTSPGPSSRASGTPTLSTPAAASGDASDPGTPGTATPDMFAAATAARGLPAGRYSAGEMGVVAAADESPVLWGNMTANKRLCAAGDAAMLKRDTEQQTAEGIAHSSAVSPTDSSNITFHNSTSHIGGGVDSGGSHSNAAATLQLPAGAAVISSSERQRLELLESVLLVAAGLYSTRRWQELGNVLASADLLPQSMQAAIHSAAQQGPLSCQASGVAEGSTSSSGSCQSGGKPDDAAEDSHSQRQSALKLGDIVVLGRSRRVKGKIRYIGPVAWDLSGGNWVGMELEAPCGMNGTQKGITYFDCPPKCATFHRASQLSSYHGA